MVAGLAIHVSLKIFGVRSNLSETCILYTAIEAPYAPLNTLLTYPWLYTVFSALQSAKAQKPHGLMAVMKVALREYNARMEQLAFLPTCVYLGRAVVGTGALVLLAVLLKVLAERLNADRWKIATALGLFLAMFPLLVALPIGLYSWSNIFVHLAGGAIQ